MKKLILVIAFLLIATSCLAADFVNPIGFQATEQNKAAVVNYIKQSVKQDCYRVGMTSESTLRMMEKQDLDAFQKLLSAKAPNTLTRIINQYCATGMCNYSTIRMMYDHEMRAKGQSLAW
ncbi:hypothetical protein [Maridesulfovibrio bastinii]|uniref:hypothetical protein n=1 Tax=Maridesulfovibrio bastinii TaxID=47157 RepID=UPI00040E5C63|nr:hypothetical protein [Maridesulfovibrio bastinii]